MKFKIKLWLYQGEPLSNLVVVHKFYWEIYSHCLYLCMTKKNKKGNLIYTLEIVYNQKEGTIEHIAEGVVTSDPLGPIDSNFDFIEEYFDMETFKLLEGLYIVGES